MKRTIKEKQVLRRLGIPDFRHMTKDKVIKFANMMPYMDREVAKAALQQFPEFKDMACNIIFQFKESICYSMEYNDKSQNEFYKTCNDIISSLQKELEKENITSEERDRIEDKMIKIAIMKKEKDTENKNFLLKSNRTLFGLGALFGLTAGSILGSKIQAKAKEENMIDDKDNDEKDSENDDIIDV